MGRSIRLRLLAWYAAVLTAVVGGFAASLYYEVRAARLGEVDAELTAAAAGLESALRLFPPHELTGDDPPPRPRPDRPKFDPPPKRPRPDGPPEFGPGPPPRERLLAGLNLPGGPPTRGGPSPTYFAVWRADGTLIKGVRLPPGAAPPGEVGPRPVASTRGDAREVAVLGPGRTVILVGKPVEGTTTGLTTFAWQLAGTGAAVLAVGLAGGWVISSRIFRPVSAIAATASRMSAANLSERIDAGQLDVELVGLATVLNGAFDRLEAAFDRQARFTADASHELRTPLAVIRSQAELTLSRPRSSEEYREAIEACLRSAERMTDLVERLLTLARADAGWPGLRREPVPLDRVVAGAVAQLAQAAEDKKVTVAEELGPITVTGDPAALAQVAVNLIANAIQYNRPGGRVRVRLAAGPGGEVVLTVEDTGCGIPAGDRARVFERFYRADAARSRSSGGTGLGLAICKAVTEGHGGAVEFEPGPEGGTTFRVRLPR
jgi:heavy metal sensor kinase